MKVSGRECRQQRWRAGILVLLSTLIVFSWKVDDTDKLDGLASGLDETTLDSAKNPEEVLNLDVVQDTTEGAASNDGIEETAANADADANEQEQDVSAFDSMYSTQDNSAKTATERPLQEKSSTPAGSGSTASPKVARAGSLPRRPPPADNRKMERRPEAVGTGFEMAVSKEAAGRSASKDAQELFRESDEPMCKSGNASAGSQRHLYRLWASLDQTRIKFQLGGSSTESSRRVPLVLHSRLFLRYNRTLNRNLVKDNLIVKVPGGPAFRLHFDPRLIALLPNSEPSWQFTSCAVVGNSGSLLSNDYGMEIDSKQAVFRINYAPTHTFERYVGSRTTFDVVNQQHTKVFVPEVQAGGHLPEAKRSPMRESIITVFEVDKPFASKHLYPPLLRRFNSANSRSRSRVAILSPDLVLHSHNIWRHMKKNIEDAAFHPTRYHNKPMSGFFAVVLASQVCEHIHMYGFSPYRKGDKFYHYFDQTPAVTTAHSFDLAFEVFRQMAIWPCTDVKLTIHL